MSQAPGYEQFRTTTMNYYSYPKEFIEWHQGIVVRMPPERTQLRPRCVRHVLWLVRLLTRRPAHAAQSSASKLQHKKQQNS